MAKIVEYNATERRITPSDLGFSALEGAGRRIGPAYREAGQELTEIGKVQAQQMRDRIWPMDIAKLLESKGRTFPTNFPGGGINFRLIGEGGGPNQSTADNISAGAGAFGAIMGTFKGDRTDSTGPMVVYPSGQGTDNGLNNVPGAQDLSPLPPTSFTPDVSTPPESPGIISQALSGLSTFLGQTPVGTDTGPSGAGEGSYP